MEIISKRPGVLPASLETLRIGKVLGKGGFAVVRSGQLKTSEGTAFPVAVKVLHPEYIGETSQELRLFKEEAELMLQLDHGNIITAYGLIKLRPNFPGLEGHKQPAYALVLEKMEGGSLARLMIKQLLAGAVPKYTFSQALGWLIDVARALQYLHNGGSDGFPRIHRDIKLENVLLTAGMKTAKLADFGLQKAIFAIQPERQQAMMVRRTTRLSLNLPPRTVATPTGLSRLAPESERSSHRQSPPVRLQLQLQPVPTDHLSLPNGLIADPLTQQCSSGVADDLLSGDALFYSVDKDGLIPVVLPNSPQPQSRPATSPTEALRIRPDSDLPLSALESQAQLSTRTERGREISRRSRSMSHLDQVSSGPWPGNLVAVPSSARDGAAGLAVQLQPRPNSQLVSTSSAVGARSSSMNRHRLSLFKDRSGMEVQLPPSPVFQGSPDGHGVAAESSPRSMATVLAGTSSSVSRLSPLGQSQPVRCADSGTNAASRLDENMLFMSDSDKKAVVAGDGVCGGLPEPVRCPAGAVPKIVVTESMRVRLADISPSHPRTPTSDDTTTGAAVPSPLLNSANAPFTTRQSPASGLTHASSPHGVGAAGQGMEGAPPSHASLREVVLESGNLVAQAQEQPHEDAAASAQPYDFQRGNIRSIGSTVPGTFGGGGGGVVSPVVAGALGSIQGKRLSAAKGGPGNGVPGAKPYSGSSGTSGDLPGDALRPVQLGICGSAVPRIAIDCTAKVECPPETPLALEVEVEVTVAQRAGNVSGRTSPSAAAEQQQSNIGRVEASSPVSPLQLSSCLATGRVAATSPGLLLPAGSAISPSNQTNHRPQLHMSDLLHLRLGTRNISVRSLRSSASGALSRQTMASAPSSPRLAMASTARRAAGSQPETPAAVPPAEWATVAAPCSALRMSNVGSMPGTHISGRPVSGGIRSLGAAADFEEVFSLTGRTGSLMYLAPEAYKKEPYNDKVDVYSLGVLMYELFGRTSITFTHISTRLPAFSRMLCNPGEFAERVAAGYRPPRTNQMMRMPPQLWELIEASWHQDPVQRPDIGSMLVALEDLVEPLAEAEAIIGQGPRCSCVIC
ncbi:hypothetical protein VaNZ11_003948 [Volvox africanus]|uniref:Protein kinase domain-containing protein n=1 Tax=Volvox africanus TaxID=51714 RepID=A0ABQ5RW35_9CHLO|nr:hypothetical protein VaNZ11_003948 [Volvox africanus]